MESHFLFGSIKIYLTNSSSKTEVTGDKKEDKWKSLEKSSLFRDFSCEDGKLELNSVKHGTPKDGFREGDQVGSVMHRESGFKGTSTRECKHD